MREDLPGRPCSVAAALNVIGEKWALLAIREIAFGNKRFDVIARNTGAPRDRLAARLRALEASGVIARRQYSEHPPRYEYRLTAKGRDLWPVLTAMRQWGDTYAAPDGPPLQLVHKSCGEIADAVMTCSGCGERLTTRNVRAVPGPGDLDDLVQAAGTTR